MSVPVFPYSNIGSFKFCLCSFTDSFVRHFIFLMRIWSFPDFHMKLLLLMKTFKGRYRSVPVFPYSNIGSFKFSLCSFTDSFVRHFIFLMRIWSFPDFHMKLLLFMKTFKGRYRSVPVFPYSDIASFKFSLCSFTDSFVRHFIFLMRIWSFPDFHLKLLLFMKTFKGRYRSVPVFPYSNIGSFKFSLCSFTDSFVRHFIFLMRIWSFPDFHMKLLLFMKTFKGRYRFVPVFPYSNIGSFQFCLCSFTDSFVRHFIFLIRLWSFPYIHMKLLVLREAF